MTYHFAKKNDILSPDYKYTSGDVSKLLSNMNAFHSLMQYQIRCVREKSY